MRPVAASMRVHSKPVRARPPYRKLTRKLPAICHDRALVVTTSAFTMRKTFLIALGAAGGAAFALLVERAILADRAGERHRQTCNRSVCDFPQPQAVRKGIRYRPRAVCRQAGRRQAHRVCDQWHDELARPALELHGREKLSRNAGRHQRRIWRTGAAGYDAGRIDQGCLADRRDTGGTRRAAGQRHHHRHR